MVNIGCYSTHTISMTYCWDYWTLRTLFSCTHLMVSIGCYSTHTISMTHCWEYWTLRTLFLSTHLMVSIGCYSTHTHIISITAEITGHTEHCHHLQVWLSVLVVIPTHTISMTYCSCWEYWTHRTLYSSESLMVSIGCYSTHTINMTYCW